MRVIFLGAPGSGKGTQAALLAKKFSIPQISTGDMLRQAINEQSAMGITAKSFLDAGELVPDEVMIALVCDRISKDDCTSGFLLDGFPRTLAQAQALLKHHIDIDCVLCLMVPADEVVKRITGRRVHIPSGRVYHTDYNPPKVVDKDDVTGETLIQREDDCEDTVLKRLDIYHEQTAPLQNFYQERAKHDPDLCYAEINGLGGVQDIQSIIDKIITQP